MGRISEVAWPFMYSPLWDNQHPPDESDLREMSFFRDIRLLSVSILIWTPILISAVFLLYVTTGLRVTFFLGRRVRLFSLESMNKISSINWIDMLHKVIEWVLVGEILNRIKNLF